MRIRYYEADDILYLELSEALIVRDESLSWNVNVGYTADGVGEITFLDARQSGLSPLRIERVVSEVA